eukprot:TRINITY_DN113729_c0_g1_i1.p1 TRINITY_DN113729_c0_g1~~TRINITY_DN113729_c0_g1_i1.p1  ORF type:complete len:212 (-),score=15.25 TRINITY_DN113729_c0_g1_i1:215-850(-)
MPGIPEDKQQTRGRSASIPGMPGVSQGIVVAPSMRDEGLSPPRTWSGSPGSHRGLSPSWGPAPPPPPTQAQGIADGDRPHREHSPGSQPSPPPAQLSALALSQHAQSHPQGGQSRAFNLRRSASRDSLASKQSKASKASTPKKAPSEAGRPRRWLERSDSRHSLASSCGRSTGDESGLSSSSPFNERSRRTKRWNLRGNVQGGHKRFWTRR